MPKPEWLTNPWKQNPWFETVAVAQQRARKRLPAPVYAALVAGSERGQTIEENELAFRELQLAPHVVGQHAERELSTTVMGQPITLPVLISPTGVQAVHPDGEVAVARAAAARGTVMGLSNFASRPVEEVTATGAPTFFQMYWTGDRNVMVQRMQRAHAAGAVGLIATLDWSFSMGRDWGSPEIPEKVDLKTMVRMAPKVVTKPRWLYQFGKTGAIPDLTAPNLAPPGEPAPAAAPGGETPPMPSYGSAPTFFGAYYEWMTTPPPTWEDVAWMREQWAQISAKPFMLKGVCRVDDARRAVDAGVAAISVSNHGGNNLDGTPAAIRMVQPIAAAVGNQVDVVMDGGVRRGSDVVKAVALGARAVMIGRAYLWGLGANGQAGVENVLDVLRGGIDSTLRGLGVASIHDLTPEHLLVSDGFHRALGASTAGAQAPPRVVAASV
jgi:isopentenyl diphosphate isomerase/L-lactate dehydrogenase-like FMN-dependent dehydrogenase